MVLVGVTRSGIWVSYIFSFLLVNPIQATSGYEGQAEILCPGDILPINTCTQFTSNGNLTMDITSVSIYSSDNLTAITKSLDAEQEFECFLQPKCERIIRADYDPGLSVEYKYFYDLVLSWCQGKKACTVKAPSPTKLIGETSENYLNRLVHGAPTVNCPVEPKYKFFSGLLISFDCRNTVLPTLTPPPLTTPPPEALTEGTTPSFLAYVHLYQPALNNREKIILGIAIGVAVAILISLLISLHCCDMSRREKKKIKLMESLGQPQAQQNTSEYDMYGRREAWEFETTDEEVLGEYTGVKPNEFITMKSMELSPR